MMQTKLSVFCDKVIEAGWLAAIIITPLFFNVYSSRVFEPDKLTLLRSIALVMATAWIVKLLEAGIRKLASSNQIPVLRTPLLLPTLLLVAAYILSTMASVTPRISLLGSYHRLQGTYTTLSYIVIFFLTLQGLRTKEQVERLVTTAILVSLPISLYGIFQHYGLDPLPWTAVPWAADISGRVASHMGNPIFLAAYLIMVIPLTLGRLVRSLSSILAKEESILTNAILVACYAFILSVQMVCIILTKSRGPWIGLMGGLFFFALLLALTKRKRGLMMTIVGVALASALFLVVLNLPQSPIASLRKAPYIGRMGTLFDKMGAGRVLIWRGVVDMIASNPLRAIIGYGPETMFVAYNPFYPPELAYAVIRVDSPERAASPDRSHNETFDALVTTGLIGFLAYILLFGSLFYYGFKWLGLIGDARQRNIFISLSAGGGLASALFLWLWKGPEFIGVGLPLGIVLGLAVYLVLAGFAFYGQRKEGYQLLLISLLSGLMAHFIEIQFGIAIASTRTYFWVYTGLMVVTGYLFRMKPVTQEAMPTKRRAAAIIACSIPVAIILSTMGFDYFGPQFILAAKGYSVLFFLTWAIGGGIVLAEEAREHRKSLVSVSLYVPLSLMCFFVFCIVHIHQLGTIMTAVERGDALGAANAAANTIVIYYSFLLLLLLAMAGALTRGSELPPYSWRWAKCWLYILLMVGGATLIFSTNINVIRADIIYKQGGEYERVGDWDTSIAIYRRAVELSPNEDYYHLFLGLAYLKKAMATSEPDKRAAIFEEGLEVLERARKLNPLNTDHSANIARLYRIWGEIASDPAEREEKLSKAIEYYRKATTLSPKNASLLNEWGSLYHSMGEPEKALEKYQQSLGLDPDYDQTHLLLGHLHLTRKDFEEAEEAYRRALDLNPNLIQAHRALGYVYAHQGKLLEAVEENIKVLEMVPDDYTSRKNLAILYKQLGRIDEAIAEARLALRLAPEGEIEKMEALIAQLEELVP
jgi:tetratricopeptide (TPR) repeat protein/O-antigen ligase